MFSPVSVDIYNFIYIYRYIGIYVCEQLSGANSSPIVTKLCQSYPWPRDEVIKFGRSRSVGEVCALLEFGLISRESLTVNS